MNILALNCGSSSVKFLVADVEPDPSAEWRETRLARGIVERIGQLGMMRCVGVRMTKHWKEMIILPSGVANCGCSQGY